MSVLSPFRRFWAWVQRFPLSFALIVLSVTVVILSLTFSYYVKTSGDERDDDAAVVSCRSRLAADVSSKQVDNDLALDALMAALADQTRRSNAVPGSSPYEAELQKLGATAGALSSARDARNTFEQNPNGDCMKEP